MCELISACRNSDLSEVVSLVEIIGAKINNNDSYDGDTPLIFSLIKKQWPISEYLLKQESIATHIKNNWGDTALHWACYHGASTEIVRMIVSRSDMQTINNVNNNGYTPIMDAVMKGHTDLVTLLARMEVVDWDREELAMVARR